MNRLSPLALGFCAAIALGTAPAVAQYANEFTPAKVIKQGTPAHDVAGSGSVVVQVQVNADGTHKVIKIIKTTNPGDNDAAMDIASTSTYRPAHRGTTPVGSFYDFTLKFNGKIAVDQSEGSADASVTDPIDALIRNKNYSEAISKANAALAQSPGNPAVLQLLGIAQYYSGDLAASAQAFLQVPTISKAFAPVAAQALANTAVKNSQTDPVQSLAFAKKADSVVDDNNSKFALGVALLANKQYADAAAALKPVHDSAPDARTKAAVDRQLLQAYLGAGDTASAQTVATELKATDPDAAAAALGNYYLSAGATAMNNKQYADAVKAFDQAIASGSGQVVVTANAEAAFAVMSMDKPDYTRAQKYGLAAVAAGPSDAMANFAAGTSTFGVFTLSHNSGDKDKAVTYLKKADDLAKAAGNTALAEQIEKQLKGVTSP
jgi:tetratricopeptide (TPR) repeat protein